MLRKKTKKKTFIKIFCVAVLLITASMQVWRLDKLPGVNGDEAWYGVQANRMLVGNFSDLKTPTGNILNPLHIGSVCLLRIFFEPHFWVLRLPTLLASWLSVGVVYFGFCGIVSDKMRRFLTLLVITLPINFVYSRFGWDASYSFLGTSMLTVLIFKKKWTWAWMVLLAVVAIHPTNAYFLPLLVSCWVFEKRSLLLKRLTRTVLAVLTGFLFISHGSGFSILPWPSLDRLVVMLNFNFLWVFLMRVGRILVGSAVFEYIAGSVSDANRNMFNNMVYGLLGFLLISLRKEWSKFKPIYKRYFLGFLMALTMFFLTAGLEGVAPHQERFAVWMVFPLVFLFTLLFISFFSGQRIVLNLLTVFVPLVFLGLNAWYYLIYFNDTGGSSHRTFVTSQQTEPKLAVAEFLETSRSSQEAKVLVDDWWLYWPVRYLLGEKSEFEVVSLKDLEIEVLEKGDYEFLVGFKGGVIDNLQESNPKVWISATNRSEFIGIWE